MRCSTAAMLRHDRDLTALVIMAVVLIRLVSALYFGPIKTPDSAIYIAQAKCIFETLAGASAPCPRGAFKSVGYGFVLAAAMTVFGSAWDWAVIATQIGLSFLASFVLARLMLALSGSFALALLTFAMHNLALPLNIDLWILRDSLFASLITIALGSCARLALQPERPGGMTSLLIGLLFGIGSTLREQVVFYGVFFLPLILLALLRSFNDKRKVALALVVVAAPTVLLQFALEGWNQRMTGSAVVSTNSKTVMTQAVLELAEKHPDLYDGETPLDKAARQSFVKYRYSEVKPMNRLLEGQGISDSALSRMAIAKYFEAWTRYPADFSMIVLNRFVAAPSKFVFDPANGILMHKGYTEDRRYFSSRQRTLGTLGHALNDGNYGDLFLLAFGLAGRCISILLYMLAWASFLTSSIAWGSERGDQRRDPVIVVLFTCFLGVTLAHAMIHLELRQVAGVMWVPLLLGVEFIYRIVSMRRHRTQPTNWRSTMRS